MDFFNKTKFRRFTENAVWSFVGVVLTVLAFYYDKNHERFDFVISMLDDFSVIEVKENIQDIKILYGDQDIRRAGKELRISKIRIKNNGEPILQDYYDDLQDFGLIFSNSNVLSAEVVYSSDQYIKNNLLLDSTNLEGANEKVFFNKLIFDRGDEAIIKITLLHQIGRTINVGVIGKIGNIDNLVVASPAKEITEHKVFSPEMLPIYYACIIGVLVLVYLFTGFKQHIQKYKLMQSFRERCGRPLSEDEERIIRIYMTHTKKTFDIVMHILGNECYVIDMQTFSSMGRNKGVSRWSPVLQVHQMSIPKVLFEIEGNNIVLNRTNHDFIKDFFGFVLNQNNE